MVEPGQFGEEQASLSREWLPKLFGFRLSKLQTKHLKSTHEKGKKASMK
jgi:hypothetical protein